MEKLPSLEIQAGLSPEAASSVISYEILARDPALYRTRLMVLLKGLPWDRTIAHVEGDQASTLIRFCATSENLDLIPEAETRIYGSTMATAEDTAQLLGQLNSAITNGIKRQIEPGEQAVRKRLLVWVEHFDQLLAAREPHSNGEPPSTDKHAA